MKILFLISSMKHGGAERVVANLSNSLSERGHEVRIAIFQEGTSNYALSDKVKLVSYKYETPNPITAFINGVKYTKKAIKEINPDVVISFLTTVNIYAILANLFIKKPLIISERNNPYYDPREKHYRLLRKMVYRYSRGYVFQTEEAKGFFNKSIQKRSTIIQNPVFIDVEAHKSDEERNKEIVSVGRLDPQKNFKLLIDAFDKISTEFNDYKLVIYGEGSQRKELEEYIAGKGLADKVSLPGRDNDVLNKIKKSSLFVLSSDYEGMPNALMEAMALGLPCISTDCCHAGLIRDGENGLLVPARDAGKMADAISKVLSSEDYAKKLASEAVKIRETNSIEKITQEWEKYMKEVYDRCR